MADLTWAQAIDRHYAAIWSTPTRAVRFDRGPIQELPDDFRVLVMDARRDMTAFATRCMSQPSDKGRIELHAFCRPDDEIRSSLVEILTAVAHYHRTGSTLGLGHSVNFGKPWIPGSACTHGLLSLPYLDGPRLEWLAEPLARFLWLIPITQAEFEFKKARGLEALEQRFERSNFDYLDPLRASVV